MQHGALKMGLQSWGVVAAVARDVGKTHGCFPSSTGFLPTGNGAGSSTALSPVGLSSNRSCWL